MHIYQEARTHAGTYWHAYTVCEWEDAVTATPALSSDSAVDVHRLRGSAAQSRATNDEVLALAYRGTNAKL